MRLLDVLEAMGVLDHVLDVTVERLRLSQRYTEVIDILWVINICGPEVGDFRWWPQRVLSSVISATRC